MRTYLKDSLSLSSLSRNTLFYLMYLSLSFFSSYLRSSKKKKKLWIIFLIIIFLFYMQNRVELLPNNERPFWMIFYLENLLWFYHKRILTLCSDIVHHKLFSCQFFCMMLLILFQIDSYISSNFFSLILKDIY